MASRYFSIPFANHPQLIELQNYLRRRLPEGADFQDPARFHLTLAYIEDDKGVDLTTIAVPTNVPQFGVGGSGVFSFPPNSTDSGEPDRIPLMLRIEESPALVYLQSAIYYELVAAGVRISAYSYPGAWRCHITLAYTSDPIFDYISTPMEIHLEAKEVTLSGDDYQVVSTSPLAAVVAVQESRGGAHLAYTFAEFVRNAPNIPMPGDVNLDALKKALGLEELTFARLPIGKIGITSRNNRTYLKSSIISLVDQINVERVEGRFGHENDDAPPDFRWYAAKLDEKTGIAWGLVLALTPAAARHLKEAEASNAKVGTSIYADDMEIDDQGRVSDYRLVGLDVANLHGIVGVPDAVAIPLVHQETIGYKKEEKNPMADNNQTPEVVSVELGRLREQVRILEDAKKKADPVVADMTELRRLLGIEEAVDIVGAVRKLHTTSSELASENAALLEAHLVKMVEDKVKPLSMRPLVVEMVRAKQATGRVALERAVESVLGQEFIHVALEAALKAEMGPAQTGGSAKPNGADKTADWQQHLEPKPTTTN